jgi:hypothetical protein
MLSRRARRILIAAALLLWAAIYPLQANIARTANFTRGVAYAPGLREGGTIAILASLGGFRSLAANMLWLRADEYFHAGATGWWKVMPTLRAVTQLEPDFIEAWELLGWHIGYNMYASAPPAERDRWAEAAIQCYREAMRANPDDWRIQKELAWYYQDKLMDYGKAIPEWIAVTKKPGGLSRSWVVLHPLAHCYEETWEVTKAVETWEWALELDPDDVVATRAIEWWSKYKNDKFYLRHLLTEGNRRRQSRGLPSMAAPYDLDTEPVH